MRVNLVRRATVAVRVGPRAAIRAVASLRFPAGVVGTSGVAVTKIGGIYVFALDLASFGQIDGIPSADAPATYFLAFNAVTGALQRVDFDGLSDAVALGHLTQSDHARISALAAELASVKAKLRRAEVSAALSAGDRRSVKVEAVARRIGRVAASAQNTATGAAQLAAAVEQRVRRKASTDQVALIAQVFG